MSPHPISQFIPFLPHLDYYGECRPAAKRGGDFFDFVPLEDESLALCLGESEEGSGLQSSLRALSLQRHGAPLRVVEEVDLGNKAVTLFYARVDPASRQLYYVNGSPAPALVVRKKPFRVFHLETTGPAMGPNRQLYWEQRRMPLESGDVLIAFTRGVARAMPEEELVGVIEENAESRAGTLVTGILEASARGPADRTALAVRFIGNEEPALSEESSELSLAVA
jgi:serine phosphatase RsbU (regulator of sigma subunit)